MFDKDWLNKLEKFNISDPLYDMILLNASEPEPVTDLWLIAKRTIFMWRLYFNL